MGSPAFLAELEHPESTIEETDALSAATVSEVGLHGDSDFQLRAH